MNPIPIKSLKSPSENFNIKDHITFAVAVIAVCIQDQERITSYPIQECQLLHNVSRIATLYNYVTIPAIDYP